MPVEPRPDWYPVRQLVRPNTALRWLLPGGEATGFLKVEKAERQFWVRRDSGSVDRLSFEPFAWRPLPVQQGGQPWPDALPEPMTLAATGRFVDIRPRKLAAMQRQAEQSADTIAELEREHGPLYVALPGSKEDQWWLDPAAVTYSQAGAIDLMEAEARVSRAILTDGLRAFDVPANGLAQSTSALGGLVHESLNSEDAELIRHFKPTNRDVQDYLTAFGWFTAIAPLELRPEWARRPDRASDWFSGAQKVLVWRALVPQLSWRQIAKRVGGSQEGWRKTWGGALELVRRAANGEPVLTHLTVADQLDALRERNHSWKRKRHEPAEIMANALKAMEPVDA
jgi:hypothetical protein